jgi:hypothetical protein
MTRQPTPKQCVMLAQIKAFPGITTAELHRRVGRCYAHGSHRFTYETVGRMLRAGMLRSGSPAAGLRGGGLYVQEDK